MDFTAFRNNVVSNWLKNNLAVTLVLLTITLFVSKSLYNYPAGLMALLGLYGLIRNPGLLRSSGGIRTLTVLFLCFWAPMLLSLADAINFDRAFRTTALYLRLYFMGAFIILFLDTDREKELVLTGVFCIVSFWCVDAILQAFIGINLLQFPYEARHITGMFYPKNTIAHICAGLSPLFFEAIRRSVVKQKSALLLVLPLLIIIFLSGRRAAWIMLALSSFFYSIYLINIYKQRLQLKTILAAGLVILMALGTTAAINEPLKRRIGNTMNLFTGDYKKINEATAKRLPLWSAALRMARDNPLNGVGVRGYRDAYKDFAGENDEWKTSGQTHPHQILLELASETGLTGLLGFILFCFYFARRMLQENAFGQAFPWLLPSFVVVFPLNTHMAIYGSYWSTFFWLLLSLGLTSLHLVSSETGDRDEVV